MNNALKRQKIEDNNKTKSGLSVFKNILKYSSSSSSSEESSGSESEEYDFIKKAREGSEQMRVSGITEENKEKARNRADNI